MSACHVSTLVGHIHDQITLFRIMAWFWWKMFNKEVEQFIRAREHFKFVKFMPHWVQNMLHTIDSDKPFDVVFLDFWKPGDIPDWHGSRKILTCLDYMTVFGLAAATLMIEIISDQATR